MREERTNDGERVDERAGVGERGTGYTGHNQNVRSITNEDKQKYPDLFEGYEVGDVMTAELSEDIRRREQAALNDEDVSGAVPAEGVENKVASGRAGNVEPKTGARNVQLDKDGNAQDGANRSGRTGRRSSR